MKMRGYIKFNKELPDAVAIKFVKTKQYGKGYTDRNFKDFRTGIANDDFAKNLFTITFKCDRYKIPRIFNRRKIKDRYK